jgi:hypothetical protein
MTSVLTRPAVMPDPALVQPTTHLPGDVWEQDIEDLFANWYSGDGCQPGCWEGVMRYKRQDAHYRDVVKSLRENGLRRPLTCYVNGNSWHGPTGLVIFGDGHHRLAAARYDLGLTTVPMEFKPDSVSAFSHDGYNPTRWKLEQ